MYLEQFLLLMFSGFLMIVIGIDDVVVQILSSSCAKCIRFDPSVILRKSNWWNWSLPSYSNWKAM